MLGVGGWGERSVSEAEREFLNHKGGDRGEGWGCLGWGDGGSAVCPRLKGSS